MLMYGLFFSFTKAHSKCFTNHWILIIIPEILLLFYVWGKIGSESRALLAPTLLKAWTLYQTFWPSFRSFTLTLVWWQPQSIHPGRNWLPPCRQRWGSHHFLEGSYPSMVRLVASTELKRLRPTWRCGATRGDREQKLNLTYCDEFSL